MGSLLGGNSKQSSTTQGNSYNQAYGTLANALGGNLGSIGSSMDAISALLGGDTSGLNAYKNATGFNAMAEQGSRGITGNAAASGLLRSGGTGRALVNFGNQMNQQASSNYLDRLGSLAGLGLQSAGTLAGAGNVSNQQSTSSGKSKSGLGGLF